MSEEKEATEHPTANETATVTAETSQTQTQTEHASESPEEGTKKDSPYSLEDLLTFDAGEFEELNHIEDINEYSKSLHAEIEQLEREIAEESKEKIGKKFTTLIFNTFFFGLVTKKVMDFVKLHKIVIESAQMLRMIKDTLNKYEESLRETTANIEELRSKSGYISTHLSNRITAKEKLDESLRSIIITPRLVETITKGPINVSYCQSIEELSRLLSPPKVVETSVAFKDACTVTALLCSIATMRIRDFLIQQFQNLAKPGANFQIYQQSILDKFRNLNHFLIEHAPHFEGEIRNAYLETLGPVIYSYFVIYFGKTATLYFKVGDNEDLLGMAPETKRRCTATWIHHTRARAHMRFFL